MKHSYTFFFGLICLLSLFLSPEKAGAQGCTEPLGLSKGTEFVYQVTDKGRTKGTLNNKVLQQVRASNGMFVTTFKSARMGKGNRVETSNEYKVRCSNDTVYLDAMLLLREQALKLFDGKDFDYFPVDIAYPKVMTADQRLPDGKLEVRVRSTSARTSRINMVAMNRKVVGLEKITTPAGAFDTYKITYQYVIELDALGMPLRDVLDVEEYYSTEHGLIKCQFTTKRGKKAKGLELISKKTPVQALQK